MDFLARLAALLPRRNVNLTRFHGAFALHHRLRAQIAPAAAKPGGGGSLAVHTGWAQRLKRVLGIEVEQCERCGRCGGALSATDAGGPPSGL